LKTSDFAAVNFPRPPLKAPHNFPPPSDAPLSTQFEFGASDAARRPPMPRSANFEKFLFRIRCFGDSFITPRENLSSQLIVVQISKA
jgi:hypothetical protein